MVKLRAAGPRAVFGLSGNVGYQPATLSGLTNAPIPSFDAYQTITAFLTGHLFENTDAFWRGMQQTLDAELTLLAHSVPPSDLSRLSNGRVGPTAVVYKVNFAWLDPDGVPRFWAFMAVRVTEFGFQWMAGTKAFPPEVKAEPVGDGEWQLFDELQKGTNPQFDDLRKDKLLAPFMSPQERTGVTNSAAESFSRALIKYTSERGQLPAGTPLATVSPSADCALIQGSGTTWHLRDKSN